MGPLDAIKTCLAKSLQFKGRASQAEFWWFALFFILVSGLSGWIDESLWPGAIYSLSFNSVSGDSTFAVGVETTIIQGIIIVLLFVPYHAAAWRRCHDVGVPGVWSLLPWCGLAFFVAIAFAASASDNDHPALLMILALAASTIFTIMILAQRGKPGTNRYGPNPNEVPQ